MNVLWITLDALFPLDSAGRIGIYKRIEPVSKNNNIYLFYFYESAKDDKQTKNHLSCCKEIHSYPKNKRKLCILKNYIKFPYTVSSRINKEVIKDLENCVLKNNIDIINVDFPQMGYILLQSDILNKLPIVLNQHNIEWQRFYDMSRTKGISFIKKIALFIEGYRLKNYEERLYHSVEFCGITFVTDEDKNYFYNWIPKMRRRLVTIYGGANLYQPKEIQHSGKNIVFVGVMSNEFNPEGAKWFLKNVFPIVRKEYKDARFYIVGKEPVKSLLDAEKEDRNVFVTGKVENLDYYYDIADLIVIPLLHGGGVKLKLLEAIGHNKLVVSTSQGVRGTKFEDGIDLYVADNSTDFVGKCLEALKKSKKNQIMKDNSYDKFKKNYTWEVIGEKYVSYLESILAKWSNLK